MSLGASADVRFTESVPELLDYVAELGMDHLELRYEYLSLQPDPPSADRLGDLADNFGVSLTFHAPFRDCNVGSINERSRTAAVAQVRSALDDAATAGGGAVVVHGGSVPAYYPERIAERARENAVRSLAECAATAAEVGVPLCLENQPPSRSKRRFTTTPDDLGAMLADVTAPEGSLEVTLDVGHAKAAGFDWRAFADRFGDRVRVVHLHDNDGSGDDHSPYPTYAEVTEAVGAPYNVFEMKSLADLPRCLGVEPTAP